MKDIKHFLRQNSLRPTKQRVIIANYLFDGVNKHVTAETLSNKLLKMKAEISLATIYNTLHDFYEKGLLKKLMINSERIYFDTNTEHHHHFYSKKDQKLIDINVDMKVSGLPNPPKNKKINKIEVLVHLDN
jgi:Fur family iron response transcriptional regulator